MFMLYLKRKGDMQRCFREFSMIVRMEMGDD